MRSPLFVFPTGQFSRPQERYEGRSSFLVPRFVSVRERQQGALLFQPFGESASHTTTKGRAGIIMAADAGESPSSEKGYRSITAKSLKCILVMIGVSHEFSHE